MKEKHHSLKWSMVLQFANHGFSIILTLILANILSPTDFGLVAMILVISEFSRIILEFGFGQALIYKQNAKSIDYNTVFWFNIVLGGILTIIVLLSAKYFAIFYNQAILKPITMVLSMNYFISSFSIVPQIIFTKKLDFKTLTKIRLSSVFISGIFGIWLSTEYGIWALVFIEVSRTFFISLFSLILVKDWKPQFSFDIQSLRSLFKFSINLFGNESLNYWMDNFDKLIIGKVLGEFSLGLYRQAYSFMLLPVNNVSRVLNSVLFPVLSEKQNDKNYIANAFTKSFIIIMIIVFPVLSFLFISARPLINILLGDKWIPMVVILKYFSIAGIFYSLAELTNSFFLSIGKTESLFKSNFLVRLILIISIIFSLKFKLQGVALAVLLVSPLKLLIMLISLNNQLNFKLKLILKKFFINFSISSLITIIIIILGNLINNHIGNYLLVIFNLVMLIGLFSCSNYIFIKEDFLYFLLHSKKLFKIKGFI